MAVFSAIASVAAGKAQTKAAGKAADASQHATDETVELQREMFQTVREDTAPWREIGEEALTSISAGLADGSFDLSKFDFEADPGYQFRLGEGMKALDRGAAARGNLLSGAQIKAGQRFAQDFASNEYQNVFNRQALAKQQKFNQLSTMAGMGQTGVAQSASAGMNMANQSGNALMQNASNQMDAAYYKGNALATMYGNLGEAGGAALKGLMMMSERRFKTDIRCIGETQEGYPKYAFRYIWDEPGTERIGVMADEVPPELTIEIGGVRFVDIGRIAL